ncbi:MAG TPA: adenylate/guanylate cyclase domain-containing protein [Chitinophagaceae bacterium]|jgi:class 3 adenylate cyclase|nr:adenylate/guanylate cyclase domain-containing protein [Chitinophagaceae bacterium]
MEQDIAILIADLSGYTALTETHGASSAADLIDKYVELVNNSLVGSSRLHQRVGDEVMIVSDSADHLLSTAEVLLQNVFREYNFLQVHGGLHYGKILIRNNDFFGSTLNLTSRIASKALPGVFLCSKDFLDAVADREPYLFKSIGNHNFKNVSDVSEVFEITMEKPERLYVDPVCRMLLSDPEKCIAHPDQPDVFFCSSNCLEIFMGRQ